MNIATMEELKKAAHKIKEAGKKVTVEAIADQIGEKYWRIREDIQAVPGLRKELGLPCRSGVEASRRYRSAVRLLRERGLLVTIRRVAFLANTPPDSFKQWRIRFLRTGGTMPIVNLYQLRRIYLVRRLIWQGILMRSVGTQPHILSLARKARCHPRHLYDVLDANPGLRSRLGLRGKKARKPKARR